MTASALHDAVPARLLPCSLRFRRPAVRDLAWLVLDGALPLPADTAALARVRLDAAEVAELLGLLQQWDEDPADAWLGPIEPGLRLGLYTERLIGSWLRRSRLIRLLAMNWPLRVNRITLGEADFLVRRAGCPQAPLQLWELACKFYLQVPGRGWLGPGLNDSLASKLARVRGHQLQLIHQPGFQAAWEGHWSSRAWMTGWLLPAAGSLAVGSLAVGNADCDPGSGPWQGARVASAWAEAGDASAAIAGLHAGRLGVTQWWLLPKRRWLRPAFDDEPVVQRFANLDEAVAFLEAPDAPLERGGSQPRPLMLAGIRWLRIDGQAAIAAEAMRLMLVPRGWSQRAGATAFEAVAQAPGRAEGEAPGDPQGQAPGEAPGKSPDPPQPG